MSVAFKIHDNIYQTRGRREIAKDATARDKTPARKQVDSRIIRQKQREMTENDSSDDAIREFTRARVRPLARAVSRLVVIIIVIGIVAARPLLDPAVASSRHLVLIVAHPSRPASIARDVYVRRARERRGQYIAGGIYICRVRVLPAERRLAGGEEVGREVAR